MSFPESEKFSHAKHPKYFRMDNPSIDSTQRELPQESQPSSMASGSMTSSSKTDFGSSVTALAQESADTVKETVVEGVPKALHAVQEQISAIAGGAKEVEETVSDSKFPFDFDDEIDLTI